MRMNPNVRCVKGNPLVPVSNCAQCGHVFWPHTCPIHAMLFAYGERVRMTCVEDCWERNGRRVRKYNPLVCQRYPDDDLIGTNANLLGTDRHLGGLIWEWRAVEQTHGSRLAALNFFVIITPGPTLNTLNNEGIVRNSPLHALSDQIEVIIADPNPTFVSLL
jgi:hypothetical protein